jgi:hypothetical protein
MSDLRERKRQLDRQLERLVADQAGFKWMRAYWNGHPEAKTVEDLLKIMAAEIEAHPELKKVYDDEIAANLERERARVGLMDEGTRPRLEQVM